MLRRFTSDKGRSLIVRVVFAAVFVACLAAQPTLAAGYRADLGPMPLDDETKAVIAGRGEATATVEGDRMTVKVRFGGLPSRARLASLSRVVR